MEPTIEVGAVVVEEGITPLQVSVGDVVTFPDPDDRARLITHRLRSMTVRGGTAYVVTKGDANNTSERWNVPVDHKIGRVVYQTPKLGYVRAWISARGARLIVAVVVLCLGIAALGYIWWPRRREISGETPA